jgi:hypothetical protein
LIIFLAACFTITSRFVDCWYLYAAKDGVYRICRNHRLTCFLHFEEKGIGQAVSHRTRPGRKPRNRAWALWKREHEGAAALQLLVLVFSKKKKKKITRLGLAQLLNPCMRPIADYWHREYFYGAHDRELLSSICIWKCKKTASLRASLTKPMKVLTEKFKFSILKTCLRIAKWLAQTVN